MAKGILTAILIGAAPLAAAEAQMDKAPAASCGEAGVALPETLAGWATRTPLAAAADKKGAAGAMLTPGKAVDATLARTATVDYVLRPEKPGGSVSFGGLLGFTIAEAGTYRVALGSGAWIDVVKDGKAIVSSAHGHGPDCSGIRKMVDFPLTAGRYILQVAANGAPTLPLLLTRLP